MMEWMLSLPVLLAQAASDPALNNPVTQPAELATSAGTTGLIKLLVAVVVLFGSFGLGVLLAKALRLPDFGFKLGLITLSAIGSAAVCYFGWPPKLGIDLSGGVVLVYEVEEGAAKSGKLDEISRMATARLNQDRTEKITSQVVDGNIEFRLPADADVGTVENQIAALRGEGMGLVPSSKREEGEINVLVYAPDQTVKSFDMDKLIGAINTRINPGGVKEVTVRPFGTESIEIIVPEINEDEIQSIKNRISRLGTLEFRILANAKTPSHVAWINRAMASPAAEVVDITPQGRHVIAKWVKVKPEEVRQNTAIVRPTADGKGYEALVAMDEYNVTGEYLAMAGGGIDEAGRDSIRFSFDSDGARRFGELTGKNVPNQATGVTQALGIILDGELISAPELREQIRDNGQITGQFTKEYVNDIVAVLNAGSLPTALHKTPIQEQRISAQMGADTIAQGSRAMGIASLGVVLFMLFYYKFAGMVADTAVLLNMLMVIALMILVKAAFTLPGLAGLVLTVGMAVDANVLIYERMREETQRGASLRMAIRNGYAKAMSTIIDSNVTTIATGVVLFVIGSDQIKGFAITLILGLLVSMYTAVFVSRVIFDIFEKKRWLTQLNMRQWFKKTNFDFVSYMRPATILSVLLIGIGMGAVVMRGKDLLDIDFTGGSSVQVEFRKGESQDIAKVRQAVAVLPDSTVSSVGTENTQFKIDTSERNLTVVRDELKKAFGDSLVTYSMAFSDFKPYELKSSTETEAANEAEKTSESSTPATATDKPAEDTPEKDAAADDNAKATEAPRAENAAQEPADAKVEAADKPAAEGADKPATDEKPAKDEEKSAPAKEQEKSAARSLPGSHQSAILSAMAFGQPDAEKGKETESTEKTADQEKATETKAADEKSADEKAEQDQPTKSAETPAAAQPSTPTSEPADSQGEGTSGELSEKTGTSVKLSFPEMINFSTLRDRINTQLDTMDLSGTYFELTNPDYVAGSSQRFDAWTLNILLPREQTETLLSAMQKKLADEPVFPSASEVGGKVADATKLSAVYAILASLVIIVLYVWVRFQDVVFGFAAVTALVHDVAVTLGMLALSYWLANNLGMEVLLIDPFKISLAVVAALLTIVGFSINDTIVIFDRIREIRGKNPVLTGAMVNQAVNETLSRTFITSGTVFIATFILYVFGGAGIHPFAFAMLVGVISGTYSTIYIAAPLVLHLKPAQSVEPTPTKVSKEAAASTR